MKRCSKCAIDKVYSEFAKASNTKDGLQYQCKACNKAYRISNRNKIVEYQKEYRKNTREVKAVYNREYYQNNKDALLGQTRDYRTQPHRKTRKRCLQLQGAYGITLSVYDLMLHEQEGVCAICKGKQSVEGKDFCVDHCHKTGIVRGLLCDKCNLGLGALGDDIEGLERALSYLEKVYG